MKKPEQDTADITPRTVAREALAASFPRPDKADQERWNRELDRWAAHVVNRHNRIPWSVALEALAESFPRPDKADQEQGELYHYLEVRGDVAAPWGLATAWDVVQEAAWLWLWMRKDEVALRVTVLGITLWRVHFKDLRPVWMRLFGDCPFSWEEGPRA